MCFGLREAWRRQNEEVWKNCHYLPLKAADSHFSQVSFSRSLLAKWPPKHKTIFAGSSCSWDNCETLCRKFNVFWNLPSSFLRVELSSELLTKMPLEEFFFWKKWNSLFGQNSKHTKYIKTLSKTYKILKNLFRFDQQATEYIHHIWTCIITQME